MKKFTKINESVKIDNTKVEKILSESNLKYEVRNIFLISDPKGFRFQDTLAAINENSKNAKLITIPITEERKNINFFIDGKSNILSFLNNKNEFVNKSNLINKIVDSLSEYNPKISIEKNNFYIYLIGDLVSSHDIKIKDEMSSAFKLLNDKFIKMPEFFNYVDFWEDGCDLIASLNRLKTQTIILSLCSQMENEGGSEGFQKHGLWFSKGGKKDESLEDIRDLINDKGFYIRFIYLDDEESLEENLFRFILTEI